MVWAATRGGMNAWGLGNVNSLCYFRRPHYCVSVVWVAAVTVLMWVACAATLGHIDVQSPWCHWRPCLGLWFYQSGDCVYAHGLCYHRRPGRYLESVLPPEAMLLSMDWASARDHISARGLCCPGSDIDSLCLCCRQGLWWCPRWMWTVTM